MTNDRAIDLWLCPACLKPFGRRQDIVRHLQTLHELPVDQVLANMNDVLRVAARKTTVLRFEDPRTAKPKGPSRRSRHQALIDATARRRAAAS